MALRILLLTLIYVSSATALKASQACASDGKGKSASLARGVALFEEKRYPQARQEFLEATRRDPGSAEAFFYLGMAEAHLRNAPAAERCLRHALELNPKSVNTLYNLGVLLLDQKKPRQAIPYLEKASQAGPPSPELSVNLIGAYLDSENKDRALEVARAAARKFEGQPAFDLALGKCFLAHNLPAEARASLEEANRLAPLQPGIVIPLADACLRQKDVAAARKALEGIRTRAQDLAEYHYLLGQSYVLSGETQEALGEIRLAAKLDPQNPAYLLTLGRYEQKYGDQQSAINALEKAGRLAPDLAEIPYSMAVG